MVSIDELCTSYYNAPEIYQAGRYWKAYEDKIINDIKKADLNELRSGKYPIFGTFGFGEVVYNYHPNQALYKKLILKTLRLLNNPKIPYMPYSLYLSDIREMAYRHCQLMGELVGMKPISEIETSTFGNPQDLFEIDGKKYTIYFLNYYIRLCYVQKYLNLKGNEIIVELGSGSGHQVEVLKKVFPDMTILCFDLPYTLYLCNAYLKEALGEEKLVDAGVGITQKDSLKIEKGKVNMYGNWQIPLLENMYFDLFWNAASFGEMEPEIVENYLKYVLPQCDAVYLLQARHGKESSRNKGVVKPITLNDYDRMLENFELIHEEEPYQSNRKLKAGIGYFHGVWKKSGK